MNMLDVRPDRKISSAADAQKYWDEDIEYKNWSLIASGEEPPSWDLQHRVGILLSFTEEDNFNKGRSIDLRIDAEIFVPMLKAEFAQQLFALVMKSARHEAGEQFYVNGKLPFNEHNEE